MQRDTILPQIKKLNGPKTQQWTRFHLKYAAPATYHKGLVWDRSKPAIGPFFTDVEGNIFLDFVSNVGSSPLGYNHPELVSVMKQLSYDPDRYAGTDVIASFGEDPKKPIVPTPSHLHEKMMQLTKKFGYTKSFFSNSGAEAVENAIKACYDYKKNRGYGICFEGAFHGRTLGALSLNRSKTVQREYYPTIPNIVSYHYCCCCKSPCTCGKPALYCQCKKVCKCQWTIQDGNKRVSQLRASVDKKIGIMTGKEVDYIIIEPIQGEGGYNVPNKDFMKEVQEVSDEHNIPLICDEIQSGMGRTGKWWACEHFGMKPEYITAAKALRIGATLGKNFPGESGRISSTWGEGNAIASAVGYKTIEIIERDNLLRNAEQKGKYFLERLTELEEKNKNIVDVRGIGLMDALEMDTVKKRDALLNECLKQGLFLIGCGTKTIRLLPPLDVRQREIDMAIDIIEKGIKKVK